MFDSSAHLQKVGPQNSLLCVWNHFHYLHGGGGGVWLLATMAPGVAMRGGGGDIWRLSVNDVGICAKCTFFFCKQTMLLVNILLLKLCCVKCGGATLTLWMYTVQHACHWMFCCLKRTGSHVSPPSFLFLLYQIMPGVSAHTRARTRRACALVPMFVVANIVADRRPNLVL